MDFSINCGDPVPKFSAQDQEGITLTDREISGICTVIFFYSKDDAPLSTKEAEGFRDKMLQFRELRSIIVGVSPSSMESHKDFYQSHDLNFVLLSDPTLSMCKSFDVIKETQGKKRLIRSTFVADPDGIIRWVERPVKVEGHVERVLEAVNKYHL